MRSIPFASLKTGLLVFALFAASLFLNALPAQDVATPAPAPAASAPATDTAAASAQKEVRVIDLLGQGGAAIWVLGLASVCLVWFTAEGFAILRANKLAPPALVARLREALTAGNYQEAWNICKANRCFLSSVLAGRIRAGRAKQGRR